MLAQRTVTIHRHWSALEGCSVTRWWLVGGMFTLPNGMEEAPWVVDVVGPGYKLAEYLKRLNNQCFVKPHLCLPLPPTQSCKVSWLQWCMGYKFWNNGKYELITAGSVGHERVWDRNYVFCHIIMEIYVIGCTSTFSSTFCLHTNNTKTCLCISDGLHHSPTINLTQSTLKHESMRRWWA
jgi:hypothetical protein